MPTQRPCLPPPCRGYKMLAGSTFFFNRSLMTWFSNWYTLFSMTTGRWSDGLFVPPPLWSYEMVPFIVSCCRLVSSVKISVTHIFTIWNSSSVIVFVSSLGHLSGPALLPGLIDWCCFYYFLRNSLVALLEALFASNTLRHISWEIMLFIGKPKGRSEVISIFLNFLAGEFSSQTAWLMLCCPISIIK